MTQSKILGTQLAFRETEVLGKLLALGSKEGVNEAPQCCRSVSPTHPSMGQRLTSLSSPGPG